MPLSVSGAAARETGSVRTVRAQASPSATTAARLASVHYSGLGAASLPKERIEVLRGGRAWVLDDFQRLTSFDAGGSRTFEQGQGDKGHTALLARVLAACRGEAPFDPGLRAAYLAQSVALDGLDAITSAETRSVTLPA